MRVGLDELTSAVPEFLVPTATSAPGADDVLTVVDLDAGSVAPGAVARTLAGSTRLTIGIAHHPWPPALQEAVDACTLTIAPLSGAPLPGRAHVAVPDPEHALATVVAAVRRTPRAALASANILRITDALAAAGAASGADLMHDAVAAESFAYSALLAGPEFAAWRQGRPLRPEPPVPDDAVLLERDGGLLRVTLNRPERRNAFGHGLRDALVDALALLAADPALRAELRGSGPAFSAGGDLDEFGTAPDPATAHVVRLARSAGLMVHRHRDRVTAHLHGACVGAGIEVPAFAGTVVAAPDMWCQLPELSLGLIPGAGGTAGVPGRIGRWRTAWMVLSGERVSAARALEWGLVDRIE